MGVPARANPWHVWVKEVAHTGEPGELKHLSISRKGNQNESPSVAASERGLAQTLSVAKAAAVADRGLRMKLSVPAGTGKDWNL